jgi:hypothetical protein
VHQLFGHKKLHGWNPWEQKVDYQLVFTNDVSSTGDEVWQ